MKFSRHLLLCLLCSTAALAQTRAPRRVSPPDVYLITIDTLRADHVHCYGYDQIQTPALDSLAKSGIRFNQAFTASPITNTSHTTILTGLLPSSHGVTDFAIPLDASHITWAEFLKQKGYHTAAFIGAVILDSSSLSPGLDRGFDYYDNFPKDAPGKSRWGRVERRAMDVVQHAEQWMGTHRVGPRFVWVHLYDPHDPYEPPAPYAETYKDRLYDGEIAYSDSALAHLISYLQKQGRYENSLIIVTGDHGEGLGEHKEETHGIFLYDSTIHVPLIVKLPGGANAGHVVSAQVRTTDILPTVLDLLKIHNTEQMDGESLRPYFGGAGADRTAIGQTDYPLRFGWAPLRSVRAPDMKFIEAPRPELYDLHADPKELSNVYQPDSGKVPEFKDVLGQIKDPTLAAGASLPDPKDKIEQQNLLHTAMMASDDNRTNDARAALEKVLEMDPRQPTALRQLGELEFKAENYAKAAVYMKRAREVQPDDAAAALFQGQALEKTGDLAGARDALEASLKLSPGQLPARLLLGNVYLRLNDPKAAQDQFEAAGLIDSSNVDAQLGVAKAMLAQNNFAGAAQQLESLAQSSNAEVFELLAKAYTGMGKSAEAKQAEARAESLRGKDRQH